MPRDLQRSGADGPCIVMFFLSFLLGIRRVLHSEWEREAHQNAHNDPEELCECLGLGRRGLGSVWGGGGGGGGIEGGTL